MNHSLNQLCVIEGDYRIKSDLSIGASGKTSQNHKQSSQKYNNQRINELIDNYKLIRNSDNSFQLIHSKDGSELYSNLLSSFGINNSDLDRTLTQRSTNNSTLNYSNTNSYICFLINDFDQDDDVFLKLEETQLKLSNLMNSLNQSALTTTINTTITGSSSIQQKRFIIYGWPVLYYCLRNQLVSCFISF